MNKIVDISIEYLNVIEFTIYTTNLTELEREINAIIQKNPQFFENATVSINVNGLTDEQIESFIHKKNLKDIITFFKKHNILLFAFYGKDIHLNCKNYLKELNIVFLEKKPINKIQSTSDRTSQKESLLQNQIIEGTVRSGRQIYSKGNLVIFGNVNSGAEILAEGSVSVYGVMQGKILAGVQDNSNAYIFCKKFEPDLISIAGQYKLAEQLMGDIYWDKGVFVSLEDNYLQIKGI